MRKQPNSGEYDVLLPSPHPGQIHVRRAAQGKRTLILDAGRRWRKTTLIVPRCVEAALKGAECLIAAPVYSPHLLILWREMRKALASLERHGLVNFNKSEMTVTFENLGLDNIIWFRSLEDPDNARGPSAKYIFVDEAGLVARGEEAYNEVLRPMLLDHADGHITLSGTPKGMNWFYDAYMTAIADMQQNGDKAKSIAFQIPSLGAAIQDGELVRVPHPLENPELQFEELQWDFHHMPERAFRQEFLAEFIAESGSVFTNIGRAIRKGETENEPRSHHYGYQIGADLARVHDFTVITVVRTSDMRQVYWKRLNQTTWTRIYDEIAYAAQHYKAIVNLDATGSAGDAQTEELRRRGVNVNPVKFNQYTKRTLIDALATNIEQCKEPFLMDIPQQTMELRAFEYHTTESGVVKMGAPKGADKFDDCVIALALASMGLQAKRDVEVVNGYNIPAIDEPSEFAGVTVW